MGAGASAEEAAAGAARAAMGGEGVSIGGGMISFGMESGGGSMSPEEIARINAMLATLRHYLPVTSPCRRDHQVTRARTYSTACSAHKTRRQRETPFSELQTLSKVMSPAAVGSREKLLTPRQH